MSDHEQTADILDAAADVIERDGWWQKGVLLPEESRATCALLAIADMAPAASATRLEALSSLASSLDLTGEWGTVIALWNDAPERTEQEVLDALRSAAKAERRLADTEATS